MTAPLAPGRSTVYRWGLVGPGIVVAAAGLLLMALALVRQDALAAGLGLLLPAAVGAGSLVQLILTAPQALGMGGEALLPVLAPGLLWGGVSAWSAGLVLVALGVRHVPPRHAPSPAVGAHLHGRLAGERDFHWGALLSYGGGILLAELVVVVLLSVLSAGVQFTDQTAASGGLTLPPTGAFLVALLVGMLVAFLAGSLGAWWSRRLAVPEATIGVFYLGTLIPLGLTLLHSVTPLSRALGHRLRDVTYVAGLLGRPELGYWLVFLALVQVGS